MADIFDMADTWNNGATTFTAIKMNVTDTASAAGSLLMDLQVGGVSVFKIDKIGAATLVGPSGAFVCNSARTVSGFLVGSTLTFTTNFDTVLQRDAADTLAQRRSTNPQAFRLYNTYTDASNYERGFMRWSSNVLEVGAEAAGTGSARNLRLYSAVTRLDGPNGTGLVSVTSANTPLVTIEQSTGTKSIISPLSYTMPESSSPPSAPSANNVIIYAEDNGSGKTRLMALFATGAAQQIAIEP